MSDYDERQLRQDRENGQAARVLLDTTAFWEAVDTIKGNIHQKIEDLPISDVDNLRTMKIQLTALQEIRRFLQQRVNSGKRAEAKLTELGQNVAKRGITHR
jgi:hypothetical protein